MQAKQSIEKKARKKPGDGVLPGLAKVGKDIAKLQDEARTAASKNEQNHERVRALANTATGGSFTKIMKSSPVLTEDDRAFLRSLNYI
jgi:hypothetical protein